MKNLIKLLRLEPDTLGAARSTKGEITRFSRRGVADLLYLVTNRPDFAKRAFLADKVIGKGAALLAVKGGFAEVYGELMSRRALAVLTAADIPTSYSKIVNNIINRDGTDICPVERIVANVSAPDEAVELISAFISRKE